jgi:hypothetical protein
LATLGLTRSYVTVNTYIYSVYGQGGGNRHNKNAAIAAYRNRWFDALLPGNIEGVVGFGQLADAAWQGWRATPAGAAFSGVYTPVTSHSTREFLAGRQGEATRGDGQDAHGVERCSHHAPSGDHARRAGAAAALWLRLPVRRTPRHPPGGPPRRESCMDVRERGLGPEDWDG